MRYAPLYGSERELATMISVCVSTEVANDSE